MGFHIGWRRPGLVLVLMFGTTGGLLAQNQDIRTLDVVEVNRLAPHRVELLEETMTDSGPVVASWTYLTVDEGQNWGVPSTIIDWTATTWNGVGQDVNVVRSSDLSLLTRVTPGFGGPSARLLESHYHPGSAAVIAANPDGIPDGRPDATWGESDGREFLRGGVRGLESNRFYNEITLPYLLAGIELTEGERVLIPLFSPYIEYGTAYWTLALVGERTTVRGIDETSRTARVIRTRRLSSRTAADTVDFDRPASEHVFYVSPEAPYFLGKVWTRLDDDLQERVLKTWTYQQHELLQVSPSHRVDEMLENRRRRLQQDPQELPWDPELGFR